MRKQGNQEPLWRWSYEWLLKHVASPIREDVEGLLDAVAYCDRWFPVRWKWRNVDRSIAALRASWA
jgi:hypothetical protein